MGWGLRVSGLFKALLELCILCSCLSWIKKIEHTSFVCYDSTTGHASRFRVECWSENVLQLVGDNGNYG